MTQQTLTLANGTEIPYRLELRQRRTIGLKITNEGLVVHAPKRIFNDQLQKVLREKSHWILTKLNARKADAISPIQWQHGEQLLFLGNVIQLNITVNNAHKSAVLMQGYLNLNQPAPHNATVIAHKVIQWYKKQALADFAKRLAFFSAKLGEPTPSLFLSNAQSRWGSCNAKKEIRLNWRLMQAPPHIINYVVCHELAHLKEMNHSAKFWAVVASIYPDYKLAEQTLKAWSPKLHAI